MSIPQNPAVSGGAPAPVATEQQPAYDRSRPLDDRIGDIAKGFLSDLDANNDPDQIDRAPAQEAQPEQPTEVEPQAQEAETPPLEPEEPITEVEFDGKKASVPEWVKHRMMADKDYRQKTMELSAQRKSYEQLTATAQNVLAQAQQLAPYNAQLFALENAARQMQGQLQDPNLRNDPVEYNRVLGELNLLLHQRGQLHQWVGQKQSEISAQENHLRARQLAQDAPKLFEQYPALKTPEGQQKLTRYVQESGLPPQAVDFLNYSAAGAKMAWQSHQYELMVAENEKSAKKLQEKVKTLPSANSSSRAVDQGANDKKLREGWKSRGGSINDPAFDQLLRNKLRR